MASPKSVPAVMLEPRSRAGCTCSSVVPGRTVLRTTTVRKRPSCGRAAPISSATRRTAVRSSAPDGADGVPTAIMITSAAATASPMGATRMRPAATPAASASSRPGSEIGDWPAAMASALTASWSTPMTDRPIWAMQAAVTAPT